MIFLYMSLQCTDPFIVMGLSIVCLEQNWYLPGSIIPYKGCSAPPSTCICNTLVSCTYTYQYSANGQACVYDDGTHTQVSARPYDTITYGGSTFSNCGIMGKDEYIYIPSSGAASHIANLGILLTFAPAGYKAFGNFVLLQNCRDYNTYSTGFADKTPKLLYDEQTNKCVASCSTIDIVVFSSKDYKCPSAVLLTYLNIGISHLVNGCDPNQYLTYNSVTQAYSCQLTCNMYKYLKGTELFCLDVSCATGNNMFTGYVGSNIYADASNNCLTTCAPNYVLSVGSQLTCGACPAGSYVITSGETYCYSSKPATCVVYKLDANGHYECLTGASTCVTFGGTYIYSVGSQCFTGGCPAGYSYQETAAIIKCYQACPNRIYKSNTLGTYICWLSTSTALELQCRDPGQVQSSVDPLLCYVSGSCAFSVLVSSMNYCLDCPAIKRVQILSFSGIASCISSTCAYFTHGTTSGICSDVGCGSISDAAPLTFPLTQAYSTYSYNKNGICVNLAECTTSPYYLQGSALCTLCDQSGYYRDSPKCMLGWPATASCAFTKTISGANSMKCYTAACPVSSDLAVYLFTQTIIGTPTKIYQCYEVTTGCPVGSDYIMLTLSECVNYAGFIAQSTLKQFKTVVRTDSSGKRTYKMDYACDSANVAGTEYLSAVNTHECLTSCATFYFRVYSGAPADKICNTCSSTQYVLVTLPLAAVPALFQCYDQTIPCMAGYMIGNSICAIHSTQKCGQPDFINVFIQQITYTLLLLGIGAPNKCLTDCSTTGYRLMNTVGASVDQCVYCNESMTHIRYYDSTNPNAVKICRDGSTVASLAAAQNSGTCAFYYIQPKYRQCVAQCQDVGMLTLSPDFLCKAKCSATTSTFTDGTTCVTACPLSTYFYLAAGEKICSTTCAGSSYVVVVSTTDTDARECVTSCATIYQLTISGRKYCNMCDANKFRITSALAVNCVVGVCPAGWFSYVDINVCAQIACENAALFTSIAHPYTETGDICHQQCLEVGATYLYYKASVTTKTCTDCLGATDLKYNNLPGELSGVFHECGSTYATCPFYTTTSGKICQSGCEQNNYYLPITVPGYEVYECKTPTCTADSGNYYYYIDALSRRVCINKAACLTYYYPSGDANTFICASQCPPSYPYVKVDSGANAQECIASCGANYYFTNLQLIGTPPTLLSQRYCFTCPAGLPMLVFDMTVGPPYTVICDVSTYTMTATQRKYLIALTGGYYLITNVACQYAAVSLGIQKPVLAGVECITSATCKLTGYVSTDGSGIQTCVACTSNGELMRIDKVCSTLTLRDAASCPYYEKIIAATTYYKCYASCPLVGNTKYYGNECVALCSDIIPTLVAFALKGVECVPITSCKFYIIQVSPAESTCETSCLPNFISTESYECTTCVGATDMSFTYNGIKYCNTRADPLQILDFDILTAQWSYVYSCNRYLMTGVISTKKLCIDIHCTKLIALSADFSDSMKYAVNGKNICTPDCTYSTYPSLAVKLDEFLNKNCDSCTSPGLYFGYAATPTPCTSYKPALVCDFLYTVQATSSYKCYLSCPTFTYLTTCVDQCPTFQTGVATCGDSCPANIAYVLAGSVKVCEPSVNVCTTGYFQINIDDLQCVTVCPYTVYTFGTVKICVNCAAGKYFEYNGPAAFHCTATPTAGYLLFDTKFSYNFDVMAVVGSTGCVASGAIIVSAWLSDYEFYDSAAIKCKQSCPLTKIYYAPDKICTTCDASGNIRFSDNTCQLVGAAPAAPQANCLTWYRHETAGTPDYYECIGLQCSNSYGLNLFIDMQNQNQCLITCADRISVDQKYCVTQCPNFYYVDSLSQKWCYDTCVSPKYIQLPKPTVAPTDPRCVDLTTPCVDTLIKYNNIDYCLALTTSCVGGKTFTIDAINPLDSICAAATVPICASDYHLFMVSTQNVCIKQTCSTSALVFASSSTLAAKTYIYTDTLTNICLTTCPDPSSFPPNPVGTFAKGGFSINGLEKECTLCKGDSDYLLVTGECVQSAPIAGTGLCPVLNGRYCGTNCTAGWHYEYATNPVVCVLSCPAGWYLQTDGVVCKTSCPTGTFMYQDTTEKKCVTSCPALAKYPSSTLVAGVPSCQATCAQQNFVTWNAIKYCSNCVTGQFLQITSGTNALACKGSMSETCPYKMFDNRFCLNIPCRSAGTTFDFQDLKDKIRTNGVECVIVCPLVYYYVSGQDLICTACTATGSFIPQTGEVCYSTYPTNNNVNCSYYETLTTTSVPITAFRCVSSCDIGSYRWQNMCLKQCPTGMFLDYVTGIFVCATSCLPHPSDTYYFYLNELVNGYTQQNCKRESVASSYFISTNNNAHELITSSLCGNEVFTLNSRTYCSACTTGFYLQFIDAPLGMPIFNCVPVSVGCQSNQFLRSGVIIVCTDIKCKSASDMFISDLKLMIYNDQSICKSSCTLSTNKYYQYILNENICTECSAIDEYRWIVGPIGYRCSKEIEFDKCSYFLADQINGPYQCLSTCAPYKLLSGSKCVSGCPLSQKYISFDGKTCLPSCPSFYYNLQCHDSYLPLYFLSTTSPQFEMTSTCASSNYFIYNNVRYCSSCAQLQQLLFTVATLTFTCQVNTASNCPVGTLFNWLCISKAGGLQTPCSDVFNLFNETSSMQQFIYRSGNTCIQQCTAAQPYVQYSTTNQLQNNLCATCMSVPSFRHQAVAGIQKCDTVACPVYIYSPLTSKMCVDSCTNLFITILGNKACVDYCPAEFSFLKDKECLVSCPSFYFGTTCLTVPTGYYLDGDGRQLYDQCSTGQTFILVTMAALPVTQRYCLTGGRNQFNTVTKTQSTIVISCSAGYYTFMSTPPGNFICIDLMCNQAKSIFIENPQYYSAQYETSGNVCQATCGAINYYKNINNELVCNQCQGAMDLKYSNGLAPFLCTSISARDNVLCPLLDIDRGICVQTCQAYAVTSDLNTYLYINSTGKFCINQCPADKSFSILAVCNTACNAQYPYYTVQITLSQYRSQKICQTESNGKFVQTSSYELKDTCGTIGLIYNSQKYCSQCTSSQILTLADDGVKIAFSCSSSLCLLKQFGTRLCIDVQCRYALDLFPTSMLTTGIDSAVKIQLVEQWQTATFDNSGKCVNTCPSGIFVAGLAPWSDSCAVSCVGGKYLFVAQGGNRECASVIQQLQCPLYYDMGTFFDCQTGCVGRLTYNNQCYDNCPLNTYLSLNKLTCQTTCAFYEKITLGTKTENWCVGTVQNYFITTSDLKQGVSTCNSQQFYVAGQKYCSSCISSDKVTITQTSTLLFFTCVSQCQYLTIACICATSCNDAATLFNNVAVAVQYQYNNSGICQAFCPSFVLITIVNGVNSYKCDTCIGTPDQVVYQNTLVYPKICQTGLDAACTLFTSLINSQYTKICQSVCLTTEYQYSNECLQICPSGTVIFEGNCVQYSSCTTQNFNYQNKNDVYQMVCLYVPTCPKFWQIDQASGMKQCLDSCSQFNLLTLECVLAVDWSSGFAFTYQQLNYVSTCKKDGKFLFFDIISGNHQCLSDIINNCDLTKYHVFGTLMCAALPCSSSPSLFPQFELNQITFDNNNICAPSCQASQLYFDNKTCTLCNTPNLFKYGIKCSETRPTGCDLFLKVPNVPNVCIPTCTDYIQNTYECVSACDSNRFIVTASSKQCQNSCNYWKDTGECVNSCPKITRIDNQCVDYAANTFQIKIQDVLKMYGSDCTGFTTIEKIGDKYNFGCSPTCTSIRHISVISSICSALSCIQDNEFFKDTEAQYNVYLSNGQCTKCPQFMDNVKLTCYSSCPYIYHYDDMTCTPCTKQGEFRYKSGLCAMLRDLNCPFFTGELNFTCQDSCPDLVNNAQCTDHCSDANPFILDKTCQDSCPGPYQITNNRKYCVDSCMAYIVKLSFNGYSECVDTCSISLITLDPITKKKYCTPLCSENGVPDCINMSIPVTICDGAMYGDVCIDVAACKTQVKDGVCLPSASCGIHQVISTNGQCVMLTSNMVYMMQPNGQKIQLQQCKGVLMKQQCVPLKCKDGSVWIRNGCYSQTACARPNQKIENGVCVIEGVEEAASWKDI